MNYLGRFESDLSVGVLDRFIQPHANSEVGPQAVERLLCSNFIYKLRRLGAGADKPGVRKPLLTRQLRSASGAVLLACLEELQVS